MGPIFPSHIYWKYIIIDPDNFISFSSHYFGFTQYTIMIFIVFPNASISFLFLSINRIGSVMASVLASRAVDRGSEHHSGETKDYEIGICCFFAKHAVLRRKSKVCLAQNQEKLLNWRSTAISHSLLGQLHINDITIVDPNL